MIKTNAMRLLSAKKIEYSVHEYAFDENDLSGVHAAEYLHIPHNTFFKTLVLTGSKNGLFVCCIPVCCELDLKKAAAAFNDKSAEMLHVKQLLSVAGYMRGACTPVGMKKSFPTFFDKSILDIDKVYMSAGMRGLAMCIKPEDILNYTGAKLADLIRN